MSDMKYAPYGVDDDPFLTHPAGAGQARFVNRHANEGASYPYPGQYNSDTAAPQTYGRSGYEAVHAQPSGVAREFRAHDDARYESAADSYSGHVPLAPYPDRYSQTAGYDMRGQYAEPDMAQLAPQRGNFAPRRGPAQGSHDNSYAQPHTAQNDYFQTHNERPAYGQAALNARAPAHGAPRASFAAPPRAEQPRAEQPRAEQPPSFQTRFAQPNDTYRRGPVAYCAPPLQQTQHAAAYDQHDAPAVFAKGGIPNAGGIMQWAGALCTLAVVVGAALWGYELAIRDAHGIPVVRAAEGPMRIAPETPGGEISAHQGLAVNAIPAAGAAPDAPDEIILAPQSASLSLEDIGAGAAILEDGSFAQTAGAGSAAALAGASDMMISQPQTDGGISADLTALPDALPEDMPLSDAEAVERALAAALAEGGDFAADGGADLIAPAPATMSQTDPVFPPTAELDPSVIAVGTPMVQLGAFESDAIARGEWANLQTRFTELMAGKALVIEQAKSGGRDFYRLRAHGFASADDTRRFCAAVLAENGSCFPVDQR